MTIIRVSLVGFLGLVFAPLTVHAATLEEAALPGATFDKATFRLWYPDDLATIRALVVLVPGSNDDGRAQADDAAWQDFARK